MLHFFQICALIHALATRGRKEGGEKLLCIPGTYSKSQGELVHFFCIFGFWGCGLLCEIGLTGLENRSDPFWWNRSDRFWEPDRPVCAQVWHLFRGSMHMCRGSSCMLWRFVLFV
jgi:hypothetical protein